MLYFKSVKVGKLAKVPRIDYIRSSLSSLQLLFKVSEGASNIIDMD